MQKTHNSLVDISKLWIPLWESCFHCWVSSYLYYIVLAMQSALNFCFSLVTNSCGPLLFIWPTYLISINTLLSTPSPGTSLLIFKVCETLPWCSEPQQWWCFLVDLWYSPGIFILADTLKGSNADSNWEKCLTINPDAEWKSWKDF